MARAAASASGSSSAEADPFSPRLTTTRWATALVHPAGQAAAAGDLGVVGMGVDGQHGPGHGGVGPHVPEGSGRRPAPARNVPTVRPDPIDLVRLAERIAADVGQEVVRHRARGMGLVSTKSSATDMVTEVDQAAEVLIVAALRAARPDDGIVGEEGADVPRHIGCPLAHRPHRRHHELPLRAPRLGHLHRRRG